MPQEASVCLDQVGSESSVTPVSDDSASLHTAQDICFACRRPIEDGHSYTVVHVDYDESEPTIGKLHNMCANEWLVRLAGAIRA